jgi:CheY-like chemotaxis protein
MSDHPTLVGLRVLVVEDDPLVAMLMEDSLDELGCQVVGPAGTIAEALSLIEGGAIDVALLDLNLGQGETTYQLAGPLQARGVPFLFVTGFDALSLRDPYKNSPTLPKPYRLDDLERALINLAGSKS